MFRQIFVLIEKFWSNYFPKRQILLKTGIDTKFITLNSSTQATLIFAVFIFVGWSVFSSLIFTLNALNSGSREQQFTRASLNFENRLSQISDEYHDYYEKVKHSEDRLDDALETIEYFQHEMTKAKLREKELQAGILSLQEQIKQLNNYNLIGIKTQSEPFNDSVLVKRTNSINAPHKIAVLMPLLEQIIQERDNTKIKLDKSLRKVDELSYELDLSKQNNEQLFRQIEEALIVSIKPLEQMFKSVGLNLTNILNLIRSNYSGYGGPKLPISNLPEQSLTNSERLAARMVDQIFELGALRVAIQKLPFAHPLNETFQYTSGFGPRWGTMHYGTDMAARHGSPILATADGTIDFAGWEKGYGKLVKIKHDFGYETRYAHLSKIAVKAGQRISQGARIGEMGNTGRSTGTHLHYEIRRNGKPINPMKYIRAKQNVF